MFTTDEGMYSGVMCLEHRASRLLTLHISTSNSPSGFYSYATIHVGRVCFSINPEINLVSIVISFLLNLTRKGNWTQFWSFSLTGVERAKDNLSKKSLSAITISWLLNLLSKTNHLQFFRTSVWFFQTVSSLKKIKHLWVVNSWIRGVTYYVVNRKCFMQRLRWNNNIRYEITGEFYLFHSL